MTMAKIKLTKYLTNTSLLFRMKYAIDESSLFVYGHILSLKDTLLSWCMNELIHLFIVSNAFFLMKFVRSIKNFKYYIKCHIASYCISFNLVNKCLKPLNYKCSFNFIRMIVVAGSVNSICLFDFNVLQLLNS